MTIEELLLLLLLLLFLTRSSHPSPVIGASANLLHTEVRTVNGQRFSVPSPQRGVTGRSHSETRSFPGKMAIYSGFSHWKWWFSIVMLNYQRVWVFHWWLLLCHWVFYWCLFVKYGCFIDVLWFFLPPIQWWAQKKSWIQLRLSVTPAGHASQVGIVFNRRTWTGSRFWGHLSRQWAARIYGCPFSWKKHNRYK